MLTHTISGICKCKAYKNLFITSKKQIINYTKNKTTLSEFYTSNIVKVKWILLLKCIRCNIEGDPIYSHTFISTTTSMYLVGHPIHTLL